MKKTIQIGSSISNTNILIAFTVFLLSVAGLMALYSSSLHVDAPFFKKVFGKQLLWMLIGLFAAFSVVLVQKKVLFDGAFVFYWFGIALLILPYFLGGTAAGTNRWFILGPFHFQPSELVKILTILAIARYLSRNDLIISDFKSLLMPMLLAFLPMAIVFKQPDLGTSMIFLMLVFPMLIWAGARTYHLFIILAPALSIITAFNFYSFFIWVLILIVVLYISKEKIWIAIILFVFNLSLGFVTPVLWNRLKPYQQNRIMTLFNVNVDPQGSGYQVIQSQIAIGSGGFFGKGLGNGTQTHLKFLPEQHNDFIFSVIGEEYGFVGVMVVLLLFFVLIYFLITVAFRLRDRFSSLVVIGVASVLFFHVFINIAMTVGLMPVTGLPLPFLSYGGSFIISCMLMIGLVFNISLDRRR
ncbi:MAG: rod shape-determining protein RodA [Candidatus Marinimicrobia bacterium]|nr:rod shape-determining protein RodA [Candidatus Neomarinimicrobiota bacterium]RKY60585.1 MAG: rod shape-determining protein RodA [Candidatus Neomarinimicrobiota bacterium]